jgi:hypothetical protein
MPATVRVFKRRLAVSWRGMFTAPVPVLVRSAQIRISCVYVLERRGLKVVELSLAPDLKRVPPAAGIIVDDVALLDNLLLRALEARKRQAPNFGSLVISYTPSTSPGQWLPAPTSVLGISQMADLPWHLAELRLTGWQRHWIRRIREESELPTLVVDALAIVLGQKSTNLLSGRPPIRTLIEVADHLDVSREHLGRMTKRGNVDLPRVADTLTSAVALMAIRFGGHSYLGAAQQLGYQGAPGLSSLFTRSLGGYRPWYRRPVDDVIAWCERQVLEPLLERSADHVG